MHSVDALAQVSAVALLERHNTEWIVVFTNFLSQQRHLNVNGCDGCTFPVVARKSVAVRLVALHAQRLLNVHREQLIDARFRPIDRAIVRRTSSACLDFVLVLSSVRWKRNRKSKEIGKLSPGWIDILLHVIEVLDERFLRHRTLAYFKLRCGIILNVVHTPAGREKSV